MGVSDDILVAVYRKDFSALERATRADLTALDQDGRSALMHAVLAEDADPAVVRVLIERGADVDAFDSGQKWTALHFAARDQKEAVVRALLEAGARVDPVDVFGNTPLWRSLTDPSPNLAVVKELLKHRANPRQKNHYGEAPIDLARKLGRIDLVAILEGEG